MGKRREVGGVCGWGGEGERDLIKTEMEFTKTRWKEGLELDLFELRKIFIM